MLMDIWSDFNISSSKDWEEKVLFDFKNKVIQRFLLGNRIWKN